MRRGYHLWGKSDKKGRNGKNNREFSESAVCLNSVLNAAAVESRLSNASGFQYRCTVGYCVCVFLHMYAHVQRCHENHNSKSTNFHVLKVQSPEMTHFFKRTFSSWLIGSQFLLANVCIPLRSKKIKRFYLRKDMTITLSWLHAEGRRKCNLGMVKGGKWKNSNRRASN